LQKVKDGAKIPSKESKMLDMMSIANFDEDYMIIPPHETKLISTRIASAISS